MTTLVIIESPGKRKKLESILGEQYRVMASFGHVRDLPQHEIGVGAPDFTPHYVQRDRSADTLGMLRKAVKQADRVLLATDPDREGESIAWHLAETLHLDAPERVTFNEITKKAVIDAIANPREIDLALVRAQEARRVADRLVGYRVSPALADAAGKTLSAGRVQSPAVRLVLERDRAIAAFTSIEHYAVRLNFDGPTRWYAVWKPNLPEGESLVLDRGLAERVAAVRQVQVITAKDGQTRVPPPAPFTTSTLQQRAQVALKFKPAKTMELAQRLYEAAAITYMRVDSPNLSDDAFVAISAYARANGLPTIDCKRTWEAKAGAQEAHEAIRPTDPNITEAGESDDERALYALIRDRAIASQLADAVYDVRTVELVDVADADVSFVARGRVLATAGWKAIAGAEDAHEDDDDYGDNPVPKLLPKSRLTVAEGKLLVKKTKAPKRYTEGSLIHELESLGIGRPSTYASILENITTRGYIVADRKGVLSATELGAIVVDRLVGSFRFVDYDYTRDLEAALDDLADGKAIYRDVVAALDHELDTSLSAIPTAVQHPCPTCNAPMRRRTGAHGAFWGCSHYPDCKTTAQDQDGAPAPPTPADDEHACPRCTKPLRRRTKSKADDPKRRGYDFWACSGYPRCDATFKVAADGSPILC